MGGRVWRAHCRTDCSLALRQQSSCSATALRSPVSGKGACVCNPLPGLVETVPLAHLSFRFSMKSSMVTWSKSTKSGLPH